MSKNHLGGQKPSLTLGSTFAHPYTVQFLPKFLLLITLNIPENSDASIKVHLLAVCWFPPEPFLLVSFIFLSNS